MKMFARAISIALAATITLCGPHAGQAQAQDQSAGGIQLAREDLQALVAEFEQAARSSAYSPEFRERARHEAGLVRTRLEEGDFQTGDQVMLSVAGEEQLTGTFVVGPERTLVLPEVGDVPLDGVLRSELQDHLTAWLSRYIREPVVYARSLFRVTITGAVGKPGFYVVPAEMLLSDALMVAGGPTRDAELTDIRVRRDGDVIWNGEALQRAITEGRTLDQMSLRAGDRIVVAEEGNGMDWRIALSAVSGVTLAITTLLRIF